MLLCFSLTASQRVPTAHPDNDVSGMEKSLGPCQNLDVPLQLQLQALWSTQRHLCHEGLCLCRSFWGGTSAWSLFLRLFVDFPAPLGGYSQSCKFGNLDTSSGVVQHSFLAQPPCWIPFFAFKPLGTSRAEASLSGKRRGDRSGGDVEQGNSPLFYCLGAVPTWSCWASAPPEYLLYPGWWPLICVHSIIV